MKLRERKKSLKFTWKPQIDKGISNKKNKTTKQDKNKTKRTTNQPIKQTKNPKKTILDFWTFYRYIVTKTV